MLLKLILMDKVEIKILMLLLKCHSKRIINKISKVRMDKADKVKM